MHINWESVKISIENAALGASWWVRSLGFLKHRWLNYRSMLKTGFWKICCAYHLSVTAHILAVLSPWRQALLCTDVWWRTSKHPLHIPRSTVIAPQAPQIHTSCWRHNNGQEVTLAPQRFAARCSANVMEFFILTNSIQYFLRKIFLLKVSLDSNINCGANSVKIPSFSHDWFPPLYYNLEAISET